MKIPVVIAGVGSSWETDFLDYSRDEASAIAVVKRCVDVVDVVTTCASGVARVVVVSANMRRLASDVFAQLRDMDIPVVGIFKPEDPHAEKRLLAMGAVSALPTDAPAPALADAVCEAVAVERQPHIPSSPSREYDRVRAAAWQGEDESTVEAGKVVAVWGPTGAPGRSTIALAVADELARDSINSLLIDTDTYGASLAPALGIVDESPGLAAAARMHNQGVLAPDTLASAARGLGSHLRIVTGLPRPDRWHEVRADAVRSIVSHSRRLASAVVVDCGFSIEEDDELSFDTMAPRRNGATLAGLAEADCVLVVGSADPIGLQRLIRAWIDMCDVVPAATSRAYVVINKVRKAFASGRDAHREAIDVVRRFTNARVLKTLPYDLPATDRALASGRTLAEAAPESSLHTAVKGLVADVKQCLRM